MTSDQPWLALRTRSGNELRAVALLEERGFEAWSPSREMTIKKRHRHGSQRPLQSRTVRVPVLPRVVFARSALPHSAALSAALSVHLIRGYYRAAEPEPTWLPALVPTAAILGMEDPGDDVPMGHHLSVGERVRATIGLLAGQEVEIVRLDRVRAQVQPVGVGHKMSAELLVAGLEKI